MMDSLIHSNFIPYSKYQNGPIISHLCYTDDIILYSSGDPNYLKMMMSKQKTYERISGQLVNKNKSGFYVTLKDSDPKINIIKQLTGFTHCQFPMQYLGCPIYVGHKKMMYFNTMVAKIAKRLQGWHGILLSYGGKAVLIKTVLNALPIHLLAAVQPPKTTLYQIEKIIADFFWGMDGNRTKKHWIAWNDMCFPEEEGGTGFRALTDICNVVSAKLWWKFRTQNSLLKDFLEAKYCKRFHPVAKKKARGQSHTWKRMVDIKDMVEQSIFLKLGTGNISF